MTNDENTLLDAVDALTRPRTSKVHQVNAAGISCVSRVETPSLLERLREATTGALGKESSKSLASQRIPIDSDAVFVYAKITTQINDWAQGAGATITKTDPAKTLRAWYVKWSQTVRADTDDRAREKLLHSWAWQISRKLDPPRVRDLPDPCPTCGAKSWWRDGEEFARPLVIELPQETGPNFIQESRALCRACDAVFGIRQLAYDLEHADDTPATG